MNFIPLLAPKPIHTMSPEEFRQWVRSLHKEKRVRKKRGPPKRYKLRGKVLKSGKISIVTQRDKPRYILESEMEEMERATGRPANEIFLAVQEHNLTILKTHAEADKIRKEINELPF